MLGVQIKKGRGTVARTTIRSGSSQKSSFRVFCNQYMGQRRTLEQSRVSGGLTAGDQSYIVYTCIGYTQTREISNVENPQLSQLFVHSLTPVVYFLRNPFCREMFTHFSSKWSILILRRIVQFNPSEGQVLMGCIKKREGTGYASAY